jgi:hypothetical protein
MKDVAKVAAAVSTAVVAIGTVAAAALVKASGAARDFADDIDNAAARTRLSYENIQVLSVAAQEVGKDFQVVETASASMTKQITEGSKKTAEHLKRLGISLDEIRNATPDEQLEMMADGLQRVENESERAGIAMHFFGTRGGAAMLPILESAGDLRDRMHELGLVMEDEAIRASDEMGDKLAMLDRATEFWWKQLGGAINQSEVLSSTIDDLIGFIADLNNWIIKNKDAIIEWVDYGLLLGIKATAALLDSRARGASASGRSRA